MRGRILWRPVGVLSLITSTSAVAQWAVYDHVVVQELRKINNVINRDADDLPELEEQAALGEDFATIELAERTRFIATQEDCGDEGLNARHFQACQGLRNLRLKTLEQSEGLLRVIRERRRQIQTLIDRVRTMGPEAGQLQRLQFNLQGYQALIQNDALQLQVLMDGYRQREKVYEQQMAEARRVTDTRRPGSMSLGAVPFVPSLMR